MAGMISNTIVFLVFIGGITCGGILKSHDTLKYKRNLEVLKEVFEGPLGGKIVTIYLDSSISNEIVQNIFSFNALEKTGYQIVSMETDPVKWAQLQPKAFIKGNFMVHIAIFVNDPSSFFKRLPLTWNPEILLLFSLAEITETSVLNNSAYKGIKSLALIQKLTRKYLTTASEVAVLTNYPFLPNNKTRLVGVWNSQKFRTLEELFPERFNSFEEQLFPLSTSFDDFPYSYNYTVNGTITHRGLGLDMVDVFSKKFNFTYTLTAQAPDENWGKYINGSWNGLLGEIDHGEKLFTVNFFTMNHLRMQHFEASVPYWREGFGIAILTPPPLPKWQNAYLPFKPSLWLLCLFTLIMVIIIMAIQDKIQPVRFFGGVSDIWHYMLRSTFNQGVDNLPSADWQRLFLTFWFMYSFILANVYSSNLIAVLTVPVFPKRLATLQEFADSSYRLGMQDYGEFVEGAIKSSNDEIYRKIGKRFDLFKTNWQLMASLNTSKYAYTDSYAYARYMASIGHKNVSETYFLKEQLYPGFVCWYFRLNIPWTYKFNEGITRVIEAGLINFWMK
ncbi:hypothetical protein SK128_020755, partial [Halocaridina rubra]